MSDEVVVFNEINPYTGMRALMVRREGKPVEVDPYLEMVPVSSRRSMRAERFELGRWHYLKMDWEPRELIGFEVGDSRLAGLGRRFTVRVEPCAVPAAAWTLERGQRMTDAMLAAVTLYAETVKFRPQVVAVGHLPEAAERELRIAGFCFPILEAEWVWDKMVLAL